MTKVIALIWCYGRMIMSVVPIPTISYEYDSFLVSFEMGLEYALGSVVGAYYANHGHISSVKFSCAHQQTIGSP